MAQVLLIFDFAFSEGEASLPGAFEKQFTEVELAVDSNQRNKRLAAEVAGNDGDFYPDCLNFAVQNGLDVTGNNLQSVDLR